MAYKCRAQTDDKTLCKRRVAGPGIRCFQHKGMPEGRVLTAPKRAVKRASAPPRVPRPVAAARTVATGQGERARYRETQERRRLEVAAALCLDVMSEGGSAVIADRAAVYVSEETWKAVVRKHRRKGCDDLAALARSILTGKDSLHDVVGRTVGGFFGLLGRPQVERIFAQEVARRIPLPTDLKLSAAARSLQIVGIYVCIAGNCDLAGCACLRDVVKSEGEARLKRLVQGAMEDWRGLPKRMGDGPITG